MDNDVKIILVEQALQSNYSRKKLDRVSLRQFVNRLLLLTQKSRIFLFYKKDKKTGGWVYKFSTHGDVLYESYFQVQIKDKLHESRDGKAEKYFYKKPDDPIWPEQPQEIGNTNFGIIIVAIIPFITDKGRDILFTSPIKYDEKNKRFDNLEYDLLEKLWASFLGRKYSQALGVEARLKKRLEQICADPSKEQNNLNAQQHRDIDYKITPVEKEFIDKQLGFLAEIIDGCYKDVCETPLICNQGKTPPNLFFFVRYYDSPETINRFENGLKVCKNRPYPYSLRIIIPEAQKQHLLDTLKSIAESSKVEFSTDHDIWNYRYKLLPGYDELFSKNNSENNSCYPTKELDFEFWQKIKMGKFEEILEDIQRPFSQDAKSFVDPALMTGFIHYRSGLYKESGLERISDKAKKMDFESPDIRRLVYLHYLFSAAAPDSNHENLGTMTVPLNVANQPYVAVVQAIVTEDEDDPSYTDKLSWPQNFHFFTDVARHCVRRLRDYSKVKYLQQVERVIYRTFKSSLKVSDPYEIYINFAAVEKQLNRDLSLLCRVWPYPSITIKIRKDVNQFGNNYVPIINAIDRTTGVFFSIKSNPYFAGEACPDLNLEKKNDNILLSETEVKQVFRRALHYLEELISYKVLNNLQKHKH